MTDRPEARLGSHRGALAGLGPLLASGLAARALGLAKLLLFAPLMGPAAFGAFRLVTTTSSILFAFGGLGLHSGYLRFLPEIAAVGARRAFVRRMLAISLFSCLAVCAALLLRRDWLESAIFGGEPQALLTLLLIVSIPALLLYQSAIGMARGVGEFGDSAIAESGQNALHLVLALAGFLLISPSASVAWGASVVGLSIAALWLIWRTRLVAHGGDETVPAGVVNRALRYSLWYSMIPACQYLFDFMDRWALTRYHGLATAGAYSLVPVVAGGMSVLGLSLAPVVGRWEASIRTSDEKSTATPYASMWTGVGLAVAGSLAYAVAVLLVEPIFWRYASSAWAVAKPTVPWVLAYFAWFNLYYVLGAVASIEEATWVHMVALTVGGVINIVLNLLWVPNFGVMGAATSTVIALLATIACHLIYIRWKKIPLPRRFWIALAAPGVLLLPSSWLSIPAALCVLVLAARTSLLFNAEAKAMIGSYLTALRSRLERARP